MAERFGNADTQLLIEHIAHRPQTPALEAAVNALPAAACATPRQQAPGATGSSTAGRDAAGRSA